MPLIQTPNIDDIISTASAIAFGKPLKKGSELMKKGSELILATTRPPVATRH
jgi:hypothetical protein